MPSGTLTADSGAYTLSGGFIGRAITAEAASFLISGAVELARSLAVDIGSLTLSLPRLEIATSYFNERGQPTPQMQIFWLRFKTAIEEAFNNLANSVAAIQAAYDAAAQASQAAVNANAAAVAAQQTTETLTADVDDIKAGIYNFPQITVRDVEYIPTGPGGDLSPQ